MLKKFLLFVKEYRDQRFLEKLYCKDWEEYRVYYDVDICRDATNTINYYKGYGYIHCIENIEHQAYDWHNNKIKEITSWCEENLQEKFRFDYHRVSKKLGKGKEGNIQPIWEFDELYGNDYIFAAFKNPKDYTLFLLVWG
jgi:hypothetical protein